MAFDIETTKMPLKFPDASTDCVMMISYLKATTKAKLRYDPIELDPEEICRMATGEPRVKKSRARGLCLIT